MTNDDLSEAVAALKAVLTALQAAVPARSGRTGATFRYACGDLLAQAPILIPAAALGAPTQACFDAAVASGASLIGLAAVRSAILALRLSGQAAVIVTGGCYCFALGAEANLLKIATYPSSNDVMAALAVYNLAMDAAQEWAADNGLPALYQALLSLGAAVSRDLTTRAAPLPRLTTYRFPRGSTSHALAYRLYGDAGRADELRAEGAVIHPAFMPPSGVALSE